MLVEKNLKEALEYYIKGKPVTALWMGEDGSMNAMPLSDILDQPENHFLVDVPAVVNPEFEASVQDMMKGSEAITPTEEDANEEPAESEVDGPESANNEDGEEKQLPPHQQRRNWKKKR